MFMIKKHCEMIAITYWQDLQIAFIVFIYNSLFHQQIHFSSNDFLCKSENIIKINIFNVFFFGINFI